MANGWNSVSNLHGPIEPDLLKQLRIRSDVLNKNNKTTDDHMFINSKTGWIKLSSAADIFNPAKGFEDVKDAVVASQNILSSTVVRRNTTLDELGNPTNLEDADKLKQPAGLEGFGSNNPLYKISKPGEGWRPVPGITSFDVKMYGDWGGAFIFDIGIQINSLDQLELMDTLYFRPGMSMLIEWGNSIYYNNKGELIKSPTTVEGFWETDYDRYDPELDRFFYNDENSKVKRLYNQIDRLRKESAYNYEAGVGKVSNFSWQYNNGVYDCSLTIITPGTAIEGVKMLTYSGVDKQTTIITEQVEAVEFSNSFYRDDFTTFFEVIGNLTFNPSTPDKNVYIERNEKGVLFVNDDGLKHIKSQYESFIPKSYKKFDKIIQDTKREFNIYAVYNTNNAFDLVNKNQVLHYIKLSNILAMLQAVYSIQQDNDPLFRLYCGEVVKTEEQPIKNLTPYVTFRGHVSREPAMCFLPNNNVVETNVFAYDFHAGIQETREGGNNDILDIYISVQYIKSLVDNLLSGDKDSSSIYDFLNSIMSDLSLALGQVNRFGLHTYKGTETLMIVDRHIIPEPNEFVDTEIEVIGPRSTVRNIQLYSSLTSDLASMIAISAAPVNLSIGEAGDLGLERFNEKASDRLYGTSASVNNKDKIPPMPLVKDLIRYIQGMDEKIADSDRSGKTFIQAQMEAGQSKDIASAHNQVMKYFSDLQVKVNKSNIPGLIPIKLEITLDGIGNFKVGEGFTIQKNSIMPKHYDDNVGFIITDIKHEISNNTWLTEITAISCIASQSDEITRIPDDVTIQSIQDEALQQIAIDDLTIDDPNSTSF